MLFPFMNEIEVLEVKLAELSQVVDRFVIAEADRTYMNSPKRLNFFENRHRFASWLHQIDYLPVRDGPHDADPWTREFHQRRALGQGLVAADPDDLVILTDADEIPSVEAVVWAQRNVERDTWRFCLAMHLYHLHWRWPELQWGYQIARCARLYDIPRDPDGEVDVQAWRLDNSPYLPLVMGGEQAGWHLAYQGGAERIRYKLAEAAHPEMVLAEHADDRFLVEECIEGARDLFKRDHHLMRWARVEELPVEALKRRHRLQALFPEQVSA